MTDIFDTEREAQTGEAKLDMSGGAAIKGARA